MKAPLVTQEVRALVLIAENGAFYPPFCVRFRRQTLLGKGEEDNA
jgi:hypothetical protein